MSAYYALICLLFCIEGLNAFELDVFKANKRRANCLQKESKKQRTVDFNELKCDLLAQIFGARVAHNQWNRSEFDGIIVERVLKGGGYNGLQRELNLLRPIFRSDVYYGLVRYIVNKRIGHGWQRQSDLDIFLAESFRHYALVNAKFLLENGASPHIALPEFENNCQSVPYYYGVSQLSYAGDFKRLRLLLRFGGSTNIHRYWENPLINALQDKTKKQAATINMLLYYGANPTLSLTSYRNETILGITPLLAAQNLCTLFPRSHVADLSYKLCRDGHARRVYRMAHYLKRLTALPLDLNYLITEYLYGKKIDSADRKVWEKLSPEDYKKDRKVIT